MPKHTHMDIKPLLQIMEDVYGVNKDANPEIRLKLWVRAMEPFSLEVVRRAIEMVVLDHDGFFPKPATVRKVAFRLQREATPGHAIDPEHCAVCGSGWAIHAMLRRMPVQRKLKGEVVAEPIRVERWAIRHKPEYPCARYNAAHLYADELTAEEQDVVYAE